jgi:glycerophosphoryl diester phosphodiesterase
MVCAHGGDPTVAAPNSLRALKAAIDGGFPCLEIDATLTKDGILVAAHPRELGLAIAKSGGPSARRFGLRSLRGMAAMSNSWNTGWEQIRGLRWTDGEQVATLASALAAVLPRARRVTIDVKLPVSPSIAFNH